MANGSTEASSLENETKSILSRHSSSATRAAEYTPSLDELTSTSFNDYVRHTILGVPRIEDVQIYAEFCSEVTETHVKATDQSCISSPADKSERTMVTRSRNKPKPTKKRDNKKLSSELNYLLEPCKTRLADGIAKVTLPIGWWDKKGIAGDMTARGEMWQKGNKLGDMIVRGSIKQCPSGIGGVYEFTLIERPSIPVFEFRENADKYRKQQTGEAMNDDMSDQFIDDLARKFWRRLGPTMEPAIYGADISGSFFNGDEACGWNIDRLDTCIQLLRVDIEDGEKDETYSLPGVTSAYLYFGMWASVFAAHTEDMNLLSINYLHAGAPKYWYAISPDDSQRFESLANSHFGSAASGCSDFLRHKCYLLSPSILRKAGIRFTTQVQRPGDAVITFPGSYHFGFNTGFNIAESTNFAVPEWVPKGVAATVCMCHPHSVRIDMNRFKELLSEYDLFNRENHKMSYREWGKNAAARKRKRDEKQNAMEKKNHISPKRPTYKKGIVVEVMSMSRYKNGVGRPKGKSPQAKKKQNIEIEQWRLALRTKPSVLIRNTPVLCLQNFVKEESKRDSSGSTFFAGMITEVVDDHVRIHFPGMLKADDIWMRKNCSGLFLDGGPEDPPKSKPKKPVKKVKREL